MGKQTKMKTTILILKRTDIVSSLSGTSLLKHREVWEGTVNLATWQKILLAEVFFPEPFHNVVFLLAQKKCHPITTNQTTHPTSTDNFYN